MPGYPKMSLSFGGAPGGVSFRRALRIFTLPMSADLEIYRVKEWPVFGRRTFDPPFKLSETLVNEARIVHVVAGRSRLYSANQFTELQPGDTLIMKTDSFVNNRMA